MEPLARAARSEQRAAGHESHIRATRRRGGMRGRPATTAAITEDLDTGIGRVLEAIDRLGLAGNTHVISTSDNGAGVPAAAVRPDVEGGSIAPLLTHDGGMVRRPRDELVFHLRHYQGSRWTASGDPARKPQAAALLRRRPGAALRPRDGHRRTRRPVAADARGCATAAHAASCSPRRTQAPPTAHRRGPASCRDTTRPATASTPSSIHGSRQGHPGTNSSRPEPRRRSHPPS